LLTHSARPEYPDHLSPELKHLLKRLLEKDPYKRTTCEEMRQDPWVTNNGKEPLLNEEENSESIELEVTDEDLERAINRIASVL
jgi:[calcium/calmodulin-dependent protein kinase] kinase